MAFVCCNQDALLKTFLHQNQKYQSKSCQLLPLLHQDSIFYTLVLMKTYR